jgi:RNA repair, ligase-Pnkp-associating, region of Hen1
MLLKIVCQDPRAPDLTFLFHKHPGKVQSFDLPFGRAIVFYPLLSQDGCEFALLLEIDPIGLIRKSGPSTNLESEPMDPRL